MKRIGVVLVTYQRFDRFKECFNNLIKNMRDVEEIIIVEDCSKKDKEKYDAFFKSLMLNHIKVFRNESNCGVAVSKNKGLKYLYEKGFDYIFTLEDDINITSPDVFNEYIHCSMVTGYHYINFALHGLMNVGKKQEFGINDIKVAIYPHIVGAFSLHTRKLIDEIGFYDEKYMNAWEHVDYCYMASKKDLTSPFWMFIDIIDSDKYLVEQPGSIDDSSIRPGPDWMKNIGAGATYFAQKHGVSISDIPKPY